MKCHARLVGRRGLGKIMGKIFLKPIAFPLASFGTRIEETSAVDPTAVH